MPDASLNPRTLVAVAYDTAVAVVAWIASFALAYGVTLPDPVMPVLWGSLAIVVAIQIACFAAFRLYRGIWRYASFHDFRQIAFAVALSTLVSTTALFLWQRAELIPRSALLLDPILLLVAMTGGRIAYRWWKEHRPYESMRDVGKPVLILGAGDAGYKLVMQLDRSMSWSVVGLLDDATSKIGRDVYGTPVLGRWDEVGAVAASTGARHALLAVGSSRPDARRRAFDLCERAGVKLMVVPDVDELIGGQVSLSAIRDIEVDDLLGREAVRLDLAGLTQMLSQRVVLVTGAGGSIGSELCRQIARFGPASLVLLEASEFALYQIDEDLQRRVPSMTRHAYVGDVKDETRLAEILARHRPAIVFHAAAYKHVPLMERGNAWQAVLNNALGTVRVMEAAERFGVDKLVLISTDKAINPTSVMGASKRLAELLVLHRNARSATHGVIVRFGNVLGSTGSVVPKFKEQIARGGPVTVTHPEVRRYFMSVAEATQLVLQAGSMGSGGEVFVLDMGQPVRILDLARDLIRLSGLTEEQVPIEFSGLRPGEKLYEELLSDNETTQPTRHPKVRITRAIEAPADAWEREVREWLSSDAPRDDEAVRAGLQRFVPEYAPYLGEVGTPAPTAPVPDNVIPLHPPARSA